jgi:hypothetical protein
MADFSCWALRVRGSDQRRTDGPENRTEKHKIRNAEIVAVLGSVNKFQLLSSSATSVGVDVLEAASEILGVSFLGVPVSISIVT